MKCAAGTELTEAQVAQAVAADPKFEVTEFTMHTPAASSEASEAETPAEEAGE